MEKQARPDSKNQGNGPHRSQTPLWEWITAIVGLLLILGVIVVLVVDAMGEVRPPAFTVRHREPEQVPGGFLVRFEVTNRGGQTASELTIEGTLQGPEGPAETSETTFDFVPGNSRREGGLFFTRDPRRFPLEIRPKGYQEP
jgi:uncharacterized protein (TIGR02588 family)